MLRTSAEKGMNVESDEPNLDELTVTPAAPQHQLKRLTTFNMACRWTKHDRPFTVDKCSSDSTGNMLAHIYMIKLAIFDAEFVSTCLDPTSVQFFIGSDRPSANTVCRRCKSNFPHTCAPGLDLAIPLIQTDMRHLASEWRSQNPLETIDDTTIHVRCGDILHHAHHTEYGFSPYWVYKNHIPNNVRSIGIISATLDSTQCRKNDCIHVSTCKALLHDLQTYLVHEYPNTVVTIRTEESIVASYARMVLAKLSICNPSTFCVFPTIASLGKGVIIGTPLYPWVPTTFVSETPFLNMKNIVNKHMQAKNIISWLRTQPVHDHTFLISNVLEQIIPQSINEYMHLTNVAFDSDSVHLYSPSEKVRKSLKGLKTLPPYKRFSAGRVLYDLPTPNIIIHDDYLDVQDCENAELRPEHAFFFSPWHTDNMFHLHNDNILPLVDNILNMPNCNGLTCDLTKTLYEFEGDNQRLQKEVQMTQVLRNDLFDTVKSWKDVFRKKKKVCIASVSWGRGPQLFYMDLPMYMNGPASEIYPLQMWTQNSYLEHESRRKLMAIRARSAVQALHNLYDVYKYQTNAHDKINAIYVERSGTRNIKNIGLIMQACIEMGWNCQTCCDWQSTTYKDTIKIFSEANVIMGPHGAGLTHALYTQQTPSLIDFGGPSSWESQFAAMLRANNGGDYIRVPTKRWPMTLSKMQVLNAFKATKAQKAADEEAERERNAQKAADEEAERSLDGITKEKLWRTGYKANVLLHCQKDGEKFDKTIRDFVPTTDKLFVIGNGPSSQNIETYLDDYDKVVRFNRAPLGVHGVGTRTDIHVINQHVLDFHGPLVIFMECLKRRRDISARRKPGQTFCRVDKIDELCKRDPSRGFLFLSIARTASTVVSGFDQLRKDGVNHYYENTNAMWHNMNAEHVIITKGKWPVIIANIALSAFGLHGQEIYTKIKMKGGHHKYGVRTRQQGIVYYDSENRFPQKHIDGHPTWEPETFETFDKWLPLHTHYVGFGTWIGVTFFYASQQVQHSYGFDGDPSAFAQLETNLNWNRGSEWFARCTILPTAVVEGTHDHKEVVTMRSANVGNSCSGLKDVACGGAKVSWSVQGLTLKHLMKRFNIPINASTFIKIDVESFECELIPSWLEWMKPLRSKPTIRVSLHGPNVHMCSEKQYDDIEKFASLYNNIFIDGVRKADIHASRRSKDDILLTDIDIDMKQTPLAIV